MNARKTPPPRQKDEEFLEYVSFRATRWVGSTGSLIFHTAMFAVSFLLYFFGLPFNTILLVLTTVVSLEAIYLSIFIQMSVNRQGKHLREVAKDVEEIQEDIEDIQEDVEDIQEEDNEDDGMDPAMLSRIEASLRELGKEIAEIKRRGNNRSILGE